ncbi:carbohydrate esterase family 16 protein [Aplosporella prunicola CBS 121167]|uniref:Carbohydrate esterase family 16 protein n=1 Tax=Aplosporella prunicola CBS 121167 TaxID=1176127 RepID=A0A6A6BHM8_9PEZI|nr:carbohydrate esterase family 16 protein [Aplosporella prunicola CBS 121167]KAF2143108.1 carbohydrate esterase family 16 protein [Aplosporella prunicola CBS 121167]
MLTSAFLLSVASLSLAAPTAKAGPKYLFSFGDSYSQTGFEITGTKPSAANPLGNPDFPGWTTSGGTNWIGHLVRDYNATSLYSFNLASGGATVDATLVKPYADTVLSLVDQVGQFSANLASKPDYAPWTSEDALFAVWLGVNDVGNSWYGDDETTLLGKIMDQYFNQTRTLYAAGARNFVFLGTPPVNRSPSMLEQSEDNQNGEAKVITQFNDLLKSRADTFVENHDDATVVVVDTQAPFNKVLDSPADYGANNATCYNEDGKTCLWYNDLHPGLEIHNQVAQAVAAAYTEGGFFQTASS